MTDMLWQMVAKYEAIRHGKTPSPRPERTRPSDGEAIINDLATTISDLGTATEKVISRHGYSEAIKSR